MSDRPAFSLLRAPTSGSPGAPVGKPAGPSEPLGPVRVEDARRVLREQAFALEEMANRLDNRFVVAVGMLLDVSSAGGRVAIIGVGKSGIIGHKIASTLASTGTPALFINAAEARHGDLGMITSGDIAVLISYSGETDEVTALLPHLRSLRVPMIAIVGRVGSTLARGVDVVLDVAVEAETCPHNLAPTTSTLATLAMGDALAVSLMRERNFAAEDFARTHPGGSLGRKLRARVRDVMRRTPLPAVLPTDTVRHALVTMSEGHLGLVLVLSSDRLVGLITDGDVRRAMLQRPGLLTDKVAEIMTRNPATIDEDTPVADAHARMRAMKLKALVALGRDGRASGVIEVFDTDRDAAETR